MAASDAGSVSSRTPEAEKCSDIRLLLSALVDNEATPEEEARAKTHITICVDCASHLAFLRLTGRAFKQLPEVLPSASLSARIAAATYDRPTFAERIYGWLRPAPVRVGLGAALAAGIAMVLIVPRMGEVNTADVPTSVPEDAVSLPNPKSESKPVAKSSTPSSRNGLAKAGNTASAPVAKPKAVAAAKTSAAKTAVVTAPLSAFPGKKPAPLVTASVSRRQPTLSLEMGRAAMSAREVLQNARTEPQIDRGSPKRSLSSMPMERPGAESVTLHRNGFDRAAATEQILKTREAAASAASAASPVSAAGASGISPLLPENSAITERTASRSPIASTAVSVAAAVETPPQGKLLFRVKRPKNSAVESFSTAGLNHGSGGLPSASGRDSSFGFSPAAKAGIVDLPVTGMD